MIKANSMRSFIFFSLAFLFGILVILPLEMLAYFLRVVSDKIYSIIEYIVEKYS